jgi:high-affinity iron transporter
MKHFLLSAALLALSACTAQAPSPEAPPSAAPEAAPEAHHPAAHEAALEASSEAAPPDHMAHMEQVRSALKAKLADGYDQPLGGLAEADAAAGAQTYERLCSSCHGTGGKGDGPAAAALATPPSDHTDAHHARYYSDAGRLEVIKSGIEGTPMVGFEGQLSGTDLLNLYAHVASLRGEPGGSEGADHGAHDHGAHAH